MLLAFNALEVGQRITVEHQENWRRTGTIEEIHSDHIIVRYFDHPTVVYRVDEPSLIGTPGSCLSQPHDINRGTAGLFNPKY